MSELTFNSLNRQTGMLEDIDEVRKVGVELAEMLRVVLGSAFIQAFTPPDILQGTITFSVQSESLLRFMTQQEQYRLIAAGAGIPKAAADEIERMVGGLSDTLPGTHPDVRDRLLESIMTNPVITEEAKQEAMKAYREGNEHMKPRETISLPDALESFLRSLDVSQENGD